MISFSNLKHMAISPAHYRAALQQRIDPTRAMRVGTATHRMVLGDGPGRRIVRWGGERRGKAWDAFALEHDDADILNATEWAEAEATARAVQSSDAARQLLDGARYEVPLKWTMAGLECQTGGVDVLGDGYLADLKTCASAEPRAMGRDAISRQYHAQLAFYRAGARANGHRVDACYLICVESAEPHCVTVLRVSDALLDAGERSCLLWLERLRQCQEANEWPGYTQAVLDLEPPPWMTEGDDA